jgi:heme-degrading monooxygenase HmoA
MGISPRVSLVCLPLLALACGAPGAEAPAPASSAVSSGAAAAAAGASDPRCTRAVLEPDMQYGMPLTGPGVDPATGALKPPPEAGYFVSTTYLALKADAASGARFQELVGPVIGALQRQPGLRAVQFSSSKACGSVRTFTVWQDEASMHAFSSGAEHDRASDGISEVSRGGSAVAHWRAATLEEASWSYAARRLSDASAEF